MSDEPLPTVRQVFIGDEQFAEQVLNKRRPVTDIERSYTLSDLERVCQVMAIDKRELARTTGTAAVNRAQSCLCV